MEVLVRSRVVDRRVLLALRRHEQRWQTDLCAHSTHNNTHSLGRHCASEIHWNWMNWNAIVIVIIELGLRSVIQFSLSIEQTILYEQKVFGSS